tara:strand:- start:7544 stop:7777 length:234 start_codon:yes stop_codon:yes gene_type:complete
MLSSVGKIENHSWHQEVPVSVGNDKKSPFHDAKPISRFEHISNICSFIYGQHSPLRLSYLQAFSQEQLQKKNNEVTL